MRRLLFILLALALAAVVDATTTSITTNLVINNYETIKDGNINGIYGHATAVSSSPPSSTLNITYVVCSPTNPSSINAITDLVLEGVSSIVHNVSACSNPYCSKPANATGCITGLVIYQNTANLTILERITLLDPIGAVISVFMFDGTEQLNVSPLPPPPEVILAIYHNTTTAPPTTAAPTTAAPTTAAPTTLPPTTLPPIAADLTILVGFQGGFFQFAPANPIINISQTVEWEWTSTSIPHTVTSGSGGVADGEWCNVPDDVAQNISTCSINNYGHVAPYRWRKTFDSAGVFHYFCLNHPNNMIGSITVIAPTEAPTTAAPTTTPAPTSPPHVLCAPGSRYNDDNTCIECGAGTYQPDVNQTSCIACAAGFIQPDSNATTCVPCTPGTYQSGNECVACSAGSVQPDSNATSCVQCQPGEYQSDNQCVVCPPGSTQPDSDSTTCVPCGAGTYQSGNECVTCEPGSIQPDSNSTSCVTCGSGEIQSGDQCVACEATTYQSGDDHTQCIPCETGSVQPDPSSTSCIVCLPGTFQSGDHTRCIDCDYGKYQNLSSSTSCIDCPVDTTSSTGAAVCDPCPYFQDTRGITGTSECHYSLFAPTLTESMISNSATASADEFTLPNASFIDHFTIKLTRGRTSSSFDVPGSSNTFTIPGNDPSFWTRVEVFAFTIGYVQSNTVIVASPGRPSNVQSGFAPLTDRTLTITWTDNGCGGITCNFPTTVTYLVIVNNGTATPQQYHVSSPSLQIPHVPVGASLTWTVQTVVNDNTISAKSDIASFTAYEYCVAGSYYTSSGTCVACDAGTVQASLNQTSCSPCSTGTYQLTAGQTSCIGCSAGSFSSSPTTACAPCTAGSYQPSANQPNCIPCAMGSYSPTTTTCIACPVNTFGNDTRLTACYPCPAGQQATAGSTSCTYTTPGSATNIKNTAAQPSVITWTAGSLATDYSFKQNSNAAVSTGGLTTSTITSYDPDTWYTIAVTSTVNSGATSGPVASVVIPARPVNVVYDFDVVARTIIISWTPAPLAPSGGLVGVTYTLFYTGVAYTGITNTYKLITGIPIDANITWCVRTELSAIQFSSNTTTTMMTAYEPAPDAYHQYLFKGNVLDTSYNTFSGSQSGCAELTYSTQTIGTADRDVLSFPYSCPNGATGQIAFLYSNSGDLPRSYSYSTWVNSNSTNWTLLNGGFGDVPVSSWYTFGVNGGTYATAKMTSYTGKRTLTVNSSPRAFPLNTWVHLAVTYEATTGVLSMYWNGVLLSSATDTAFVSDWKSGLPLRINSPAPGLPYLNGMVSEVQVFNAALRPSQVQSVYMFKVKQTVPTPTGCTIKIPVSFASVNISDSQVVGSGTLYTGGQSVVSSSVNIFANAVVCPPGQITSEDTVDFIYSYQCQQVGGLWQFSSIVERSHSTAGGQAFRESYWQGAVLPYDVMNVTCNTPFTVAIPAPVVQLSFDSGTFTDTSSNQYTTTVQSDVVVTTEPRRGLVASFPSTGASRKYVKINTVTLPKSYTMSAYVYIKSGGTANNIIIQGTGLTGVTSTIANAFALTSSNTGNVQLQYRQYAGGSPLIVSANTLMIAVTKWIHITITYDADIGLLSAFMEGVRQQGANTVANATNAHRTAWQGGLGIELGTSHSTTGTSFLGFIDQFMLFNSVLNDTQIKQNYDQSYMPITPVNVPVVDPITSPILNSASNPATLTWVAPASPPANQMIYKVTVNGVVSYVYYGSPSFTISSYVATSSYTVSVLSMNKYGTSTTAVSGTIPAAPSSLTSTQTVSGSGTLSWSSPSSGFTYFNVYTSYNGSSTISATANQTSATIAWSNLAGSITFVLQTVNGVMYSGNTTTTIIISGPPPSDPYVQVLMYSNLLDTSVNSFAVSSLGSGVSVNQVVGGRTATQFGGLGTIVFPSTSVMTKSFTFAAWVYRTSSSGFWVLTGFSPANADHFIIYSASNTDVTYACNGANNLASVSVSDPTPLPLNGWAHIGVTYDATTGTMTVYRNGNIVQQSAAVAGMVNNWNTRPVPNIGGTYINGAASSNGFVGAVSDYYIFNYPLTSAKVKALYSFVSPTYTPSSCRLDLDTSISNAQVQVNFTAATPSTLIGGTSVSFPIGTTVYITNPVCATNGHVTSEDVTGYNYYYTCANSGGLVSVGLNNRCTGTSGGTGCTATSTSTASFALFPVTCAQGLPARTLALPLEGGFSNLLDSSTSYSFAVSANQPTIAYDIRMGSVAYFNALTSTKKGFQYSSIALGTSYTYSFWVKMDAANPRTEVNFISNADQPTIGTTTTQGAYFAGTDPSGFLIAGHYSGGGIVSVANYYDLLVYGVWTHILVTYNGITGVMKMYQDKVLIESITATSGQRTAWTGGGSAFTVGTVGSQSSVAFRGWIDQIHVYGTSINTTFQLGLDYNIGFKPASPILPVPRLAIAGTSISTTCSGANCIFDYSGNNAIGTITSVPTANNFPRYVEPAHGGLGITGRLGNSLYSANSRFMANPYTAQLMPTSYTLGVWISQMSFQPNKFFANVGSTDAQPQTVEQSFSFGIVSNRFTHSKYAGGIVASITAAGTQNYQIWEHYAVTYDATTGVMVMYRNGQQTATTTASAGHISAWTSQQQVQLSVADNGGGFVGDLAHLMLYNTAFTAAQAAELYRQTSTSNM